MAYIPPHKRGLKEIPKFRKKVFVIPVLRDQVLLVQDRNTREWGFISGGVKKNETYAQAAERELFEETSGLIQLNKIGMVSNFQTDYRPDELLTENKRRGEKVSSHYKVFWVPITDAIARRLETQFVPNEEVIRVKIGDYYSFKNRWIVCDMFMNAIKKNKIK